jgi:hypothetical protein
MAEPSGNWFSKHWTMMLMTMVLLVALFLGYRYATNYDFWEKLTGNPDANEPPPPPPSDKVMNAPGPDNNVKTLGPQEEEAAQPPSPIESQKDPSKPVGEEIKK